MVRTLNQMVAEAVAAVPAVSPVEASRWLERDPMTLVVDVRDAHDLDGTGIIPGAANIPLGSLPYRADHEIAPAWRDPRFANFDRPLLVTCDIGPLGALGAHLLQEMGYRNVAFIAGGTQGWLDAGLQTIPAADAA